MAKNKKSNEGFWWYGDWKKSQNQDVPSFFSMGLSGRKMGCYGSNKTEAWLAAREQLWAMREGLA